MTKTVTPTPSLINSEEELQKLAEVLCNLPIIAVDTESNSLYAYQEEVCLLQFSTPSADYLIDPFALGNEAMQILAPVFASPSVEKVFHALEYDLIVLRRDFAFTFENVFDTMWAASILGREEVGLGAILQAEFSVHIDKRYQKANWGQRPLPEHLLHYAALDTHYLIPLRNRLRTQLERCGRWELAQEDFRRFCLPNSETRTEPNHSEAAGSLARHLSVMHRLTAQQSAVLEDLYSFRDSIARERNKAPFRVLDDNQLLALAQTCPDTFEALSKLKILSPRVLKQYGNGLLAAIRKGIANPYPQSAPPRARNPRYGDEPYATRLNILRDWRKLTAASLHVKSDVVLPKPYMEQIARQNPAQMEDLGKIMQESPWRLTHFGPSILEALSS